jgi:multicomponent Na+:H+ antiporter subunit F
MCIYRIGHGPTAPDRTVAIDILGTVVVGFVCLSALISNKDFYINLAIGWALVSFIGTLALSKHLEGRRLDD